MGLMALVFVCGFVTGYLGKGLFDAGSVEQDTRLRIDATLQDLSNQLSLSPSQMEQIRAILDDVIMEEAELLSELRLNQMSARERISNFLTPEQNRQFVELMERAGDSRITGDSRIIGDGQVAP